MNCTALSGTARPCLWSESLVLHIDASNPNESVCVASHNVYPQIPKNMSRFMSSLGRRKLHLRCFCKAECLFGSLHRTGSVIHLAAMTLARKPYDFIRWGMKHCMISLGLGRKTVWFYCLFGWVLQRLVLQSSPGLYFGSWFGPLGLFSIVIKTLPYDRVSVWCHHVQ